MAKRGKFKPVNFKRGDVITLADTSKIRNALFDKIAKQNKHRPLKYRRERKAILKTIKFRII
jgi:hypothetical protein